MGYPLGGRSSRGRNASSTSDLPGFYPAVYPSQGGSNRPWLDCLSRTSRPLARAGTLDAHCWFYVCKLYAGVGSAPHAAHNCIRNRDLPVASGERYRCDQDVVGEPRTVFEQDPIQLPENGIRPGRVSAAAADRFALRRSRGCGPGSDPSGSGTPACASFPAHVSGRVARRKCIPPALAGVP